MPLPQLRNIYECFCKHISLLSRRVGEIKRHCVSLQILVSLVETLCNVTHGFVTTIYRARNLRGNFHPYEQSLSMSPQNKAVLRITRP